MIETPRGVLPLGTNSLCRLHPPAFLCVSQAAVVSATVESLPQKRPRVDHRQSDCVQSAHRTENTSASFPDWWFRGEMPPYTVRAGSVADSARGPQRI